MKKILVLSLLFLSSFFLFGCGERKEKKPTIEKSAQVVMNLGDEISYPFDVETNYQNARIQIYNDSVLRRDKYNRVKVIGYGEAVVYLEGVEFFNKEENRREIGNYHLDVFVFDKENAKKISSLEDFRYLEDGMTYYIDSDIVGSGEPIYFPCMKSPGSGLENVTILNPNKHVIKNCSFFSVNSMFLFPDLHGAYFDGLYFENCTFDARDDKAVNLFAANVSNSHIENLSFENCQVISYRGLDGLFSWICDSEIHNLYFNGTMDLYDGTLESGKSNDSLFARNFEYTKVKNIFFNLKNQIKKEYCEYEYTNGFWGLVPYYLCRKSIFESPSIENSLILYESNLTKNGKIIDYNGNYPYTIHLKTSNTYYVSNKKISSIVNKFYGGTLEGFDDEFFTEIQKKGLTQLS